LQVAGGRQDTKLFISYSFSFPGRCFPINATQFTDVMTVASDHCHANNDIVSTKNAHKLSLTKVPKEDAVMNSTAAQGSVCKHKAQ
jgi:hypothetical protein